LQIQYKNKKTQADNSGHTKAFGTTWDGNACRRWVCVSPTSPSYSWSGPPIRSESLSRSWAYCRLKLVLY
jgi:hypothetical protein